MKSKNFLVGPLLLFLQTFSATVSNAQSCLFAKQVLGAGSNEAGYAIAVDLAGNIFSTGSFEGTADFDPSAGTYSLVSTGGQDIFISKSDPFGNLLWAKKMGSTAYDISYAVATDAPGNVFITGYFHGTVDFDPGVGTFTLTAAGKADIFVCKLDPAGDLLWAKRMGGAGDFYGNDADVGISIAVDSVGNVYTAGGFGWANGDFDPGPGTYYLNSAGAGDIFISKLDAAGDFIWAKRLGAGGGDRCGSMILDKHANVYTTGYFQGTADFDPGPGTYNIPTNGVEDIFISKLTPTGNFVLAKTMGGLSGDHGISIAVDSAANIYTTGYFQGTVDFDPGPGTSNLTSPVGQETFLSKLDAGGNFLWVLDMAGLTIIDIASDSAGNIYSTGCFLDTVDFDPGPGSYNLVSSGYDEIFISKLNFSGNFVWAKQMGGASYDRSNSLWIDRNCNVYTTGKFSSSGDFDPGAGTYGIGPAGGGYDIFISKIPYLSISCSVNNVSCHGGSDGAATLNIVEGSPGFMYSWSNGGTTSLVTGLSAGSYIVTVTDAGSCTTAESVMIGQPNVLIVSVNNDTIYAGQSISLCASPSGGTANMSYLWASGQSSNCIIIHPSVTTTYSVSILDSKGCSATDDGTIVVKPAVNSVCFNKDFEEGNFIGWTALSGLDTGNTFISWNGGLNFLGNNSAASSASQHTLLTVNGLDPYAIDSVTGQPDLFMTKLAPYGGGYSIRLGNTQIGSGAEGLRFLVSPTLNDSIFTYQYACVFQNAWHITSHEPGFMVNVYDSVGQKVNQFCDTLYGPDPQTTLRHVSLSAPDTSILYKRWSAVNLDFSAYIGKTLVIEFVNFDCSQTGHWGYTYLDVSCFALLTDIPFVLNNAMISIYPNPTTGKFKVQGRIDGFEVYNSLGERILLNMQDQANLEVDLSSQHSGIYFLKLKTPEGVISKKVVIQK